MREDEGEREREGGREGGGGREREGGREGGREREIQLDDRRLCSHLSGSTQPSNTSC